MGLRFPFPLRFDIIRKHPAERGANFGRESDLEINESVENYLEAILMLKEKNGMVRSIDVVRLLNFSKPSISRAMSRLRENGYITMDGEGWLELTEKGYEIAARIYERHQLFTQWLVALGVSPETAREDSCRIEHDISEESFEKIKAHIEKYRQDQ